MAYTKHGHHIPGTLKGSDKPPFIARCGGPGMCGECSKDAAAAVYKEVRWDLWVDDGVNYVIKARALIRAYVDRRFGPSRDDVPDYDVYIVWFSKTLENWKAMVGTTLNDKMYYEVIYNGTKSETYIHAYRQLETVTIPD